MIKYLLLFPLILFAFTPKPSNPKIRARFATLDPTSLAKNFAFYELYPETKEGEMALQRALKLLNTTHDLDLNLPRPKIWPLIYLINRQDEVESFSEEDLTFISEIAKYLPNRKLKGYPIHQSSEVLTLKPGEIDLTRALFLEQFGNSDDALKKMKTYEAMIDLMALQILARVKMSDPPEEKIFTINEYIFHEMGFRFPPHSLWAKDIDEYTFLPSVIDSRKGVCLGVSILYLCLAQRLNLELEAITPPGHIYVRYKKKDGSHLNIETTARGIDIPSEKYLGVETRKLQQRSIKEVIGLAFINQASVSWTKKNYNQAIHLYKKAEKFMPDDYLLKQFLAYNYLFIGEVEKGKTLLQQTKNQLPDYAVSKDTISEDYLSNKVSIEGIQALFTKVDESRSSILKKQEELQTIIDQYPQFRAGILSLAGTYMQLGRKKEALSLLLDYEKIDSEDAVVNYYLAAICYERYDFLAAHKYLRKASALTGQKKHNPKALKELKLVLNKCCID